MKKTYIKPLETGIKKFLGELEAEVMEILWERDSLSSVKDVYETIKGERDIAYTTILTIMSRLYHKGLLNRVKDGRCYLYTPSYKRDDFIESFNKRTLSGLFKDFREPTLSHFVDMLEESDPEALKSLYRLLRERFKTQGD